MLFRYEGRLKLQHDSTLYIFLPSDLKWLLKKLGVEVRHNMPVKIHVRVGKRCVRIVVHLPVSNVQSVEETCSTRSDTS